MSAACPRYGFDLQLRLDPGLDDTSHDALRDALDGVLWSLGLDASRSGASVWTLVVTRDGSQATHADREALAAWAASRPEIVAHETGPLVDLSDVA